MKHLIAAVVLSAFATLAPSVRAQGLVSFTSASDADGFDFTNRIVTVTVGEVSPSAPAGARLRCAVTGRGGVVATVETALSGAGDYSFDVGPLEPRQTYDYTVSLAGGDDSISSTLTTANVGDWFAADGATDVATGGAWTDKPQVRDGAYELGGYAERSFAAREKHDGAARVSARISVRGGCTLEEAAELLAGCGSSPHRGGLTVIRDENGSLAWYGLVTEDGQPAFRKLVGVTPVVGESYENVMEIARAGDQEQVSYLIGSGNGEPTRLRDESGRTWFDGAEASVPFAGQMRFAGMASLASLSGSYIDSSVASVGGVYYASLDEALKAYDGRGVKLLTNATFEPATVDSDRYLVEANGHTVGFPTTPNVSFDAEKGALSVREAEIMEPAGNWNVSNLAELTNAFAKATSGQTIVIGPGLYDLTQIEPANVSDYAICYLCAKSKALHLRGRVKKHWSKKSRDQETVLKGGENGAILYLHAGSGRNSTIRNISFEDGYYPTQTSFSPSCKGGGAIASVGSDGYVPALGQGFATNCVFRNCGTDYDGGATHGFAVYDSYFTNNYAKGFGGGAYGTDKTGSGSNKNTNNFVNCVFVCNRADGGGAGLYCDALEKVTDCTFVGNETPNNGGGLSVDKGANGVVENCTFGGNRVSTSGAGLNFAAAGLVRNCTFQGNVAGYGGGGIACDSCAGRAVGCTFADNTCQQNASSLGGQIRRVKDVEDCTFTGKGDVLAGNLSRCVFDGCSSDFNSSEAGLITHNSQSGAGRLVNCLIRGCSVVRLVTTTGAARTECVNCTFVENVVPPDGFMLYAFRNGGGSAQSGVPVTNVCVNCLFAGNDCGSGAADVSCYGTGTYVPAPAQNIFSNCLYEVGISHGGGSAQVEVDTVRAPAKFALGDRHYPEAFPYLPKPTSAAVNAGLDVGWTADDVDLAGASRVVDGRVDIGCYECTLTRPGSLMILR